MKTRFSPLVVAIGIALGLAGCSDSNHLSKSEVSTSTPRPELTQNYSYQFVFKDVATDELITDELTVNFTGLAVDAGLVVDVNNSSVKNKSFKTASGLLSVAADFDASHTSFSVLAGNTALGWTPTGTQVSKDTSSTGNQVITIKMINPKSTTAINANPDLALAVATQTLTAPSDGSITATPVTLETPSKTATDDNGNTEDIGAATISLPAGVNALDENGQKIMLSGALSASTVKYGNNSASSMSAFPGGFSPTVVDQSGQTDATGAFITGGFAQFNLTDSTGKAIKKFDKPVTLTIDLPKGSVNPQTGNPVADGDTYPVWSFDEASGQWKFEANGTVAEKTPVDPNNFVVSFPSTHLSYWNLDYLSRTCEATLTLNRSADDDRSLSVDLVGATGARFSHTFYDVQDSVQNFARYPLNQRVNVTVRNDQNVVIARSSSPMNLCNGGNINIPAPPAVARARLTVNVTESCPSGTNTRPSPTFVTFYDGNLVRSGYATTNASRTAASITFTGIANNTRGKVYAYNPYTTQNSTPQTITVTAPSTTASVNFPNLNCQVVSGATGSGN